MHNNLMVNQKLNEFEEGIAQLETINRELIRDRKLKVTVSAYDKILEQLPANKQEIVDRQLTLKQLIIKGIVCTNKISEIVSSYEIKYDGLSYKVKEMGSYISKNIDSCSIRLKDKFEVLRIRLSEINKLKEETHKLLCPDIDTYYHFLNMHPIDKNDLLGIYSFNRDKVRDDGTRVNYVGTNKAIEKLPEIINGQEFFKWMSWNCALLNNINLYFYFGDKSYEKMKGAGLDMFSALQEITKTPIEAVSVKQDEWGNVVGVERKKPFLRLVIDKFRK